MSALERFNYTFSTKDRKIDMHSGLQTSVYEYSMQKETSKPRRKLSLDTGRKLNVHETWRKHPGFLLNLLCMSNTGPASRGYVFVIAVANIELGM